MSFSISVSDSTPDTLEELGHAAIAEARRGWKACFTRPGGRLPDEIEEEMHEAQMSAAAKALGAALWLVKEQGLQRFSVSLSGHGNPFPGKPTGNWSQDHFSVYVAAMPVEEPDGDVCEACQ
jgi:hypothetical protein